ncbi:hypothetical protein [Deinococcus sp.]|uniref:hypothetical protein n=1 Tax=Deinococcus sp. TaxID=47478 RepID=UPI0025C42FD1|nr:hypothetical protein [Deinococcus sp.]
MTRKARDANNSSWNQWGTPYLRDLRDTLRSRVPPAQAPAPPISPEALRRALLAEEQRQVFALLYRLRRARQD